ncbi:hypothetical protein P389DRAFT_168692 [Cystobasidium minutum MCA 4210]|uniref:uncharacterized protein n=1 Tax=Cystobasidium minutum MCA 4210 TaxID=1397322 RepID=UPI0034CF9D10|eukprot:jgi/Rhomi1/168692/fgenesh1_kg.3_\
MLSWWNGKTRQKPDHITIEPIFDKDPPLYFLYPHAKLPGSTAPKTTRISGKFLLILRQPEHLLAVFAQLTTTCLLRIGKELIDKDGLPPLSCQVAITPGEFPPGEYELPFAFDVPCDYWGRSAIIDPDDRDDERDFGLIYTLDLHITRSLGQNRSDTILVQFPKKNDVDRAMSSHSDNWRNLYQTKFFSLVCCPVDPGELAPPLERAIEEFAPQLGPITLLITSRTFTIGALVNFNINLPAVPAECKLSEIRGSVQAQFTWTPFKGGKSWTDIPIKYPMFALDGASLEKDSVSGALSASTSARLPNDRIIGPSSVKHVRTPLAITHHLLVEFDIVDETGHRKIITIREPVDIASCLLISEQVNLPTYGSKPLPRDKFQPNRKNERHACACGFTIEQLMEREYEGIELEQHYEPPELKSPEERARSSNAGT